MQDIKGPKFVFAHLLVPHDPFVFDRNGDLVTSEGAKSKSRNENYLEQLMFANKRIMEIVDLILSRSETPPIIIVQGDEGSYPDKIFRNHDDEDAAAVEKFDWEQASTVSILNAYYLPDFDESVLYPSITPVNSFRVIFNHYFHSDYKLLPDETYFILGPKVINVTSYFKSD